MNAWPDSVPYCNAQPWTETEGFEGSKVQSLIS